jgi:DNA-3-methyladenine glycosylase
VQTVALAKALVGLCLVRRSPDGITAGRIVEVEAYLQNDPASHAYGGRTARNAAMFAPPHRAYVYFIYGNHWCFNVTAERDAIPGAVLIRALEPLDGLATMRARRASDNDRDLCRGPGRLCAALAIDGSFDGSDLVAGRRLYLAQPVRPADRVLASARIGITHATSRRLRFYEAGNPFVSGPRSLSPA